jgi:hypothetical protein
MAKQANESLLRGENAKNDLQVDSALHDLLPLLETSYRLEFGRTQKDPPVALSREGLEKQFFGKQYLESISSLDQILRTEIHASSVSHDGYLRYVTEKLLQESPESRKEGFFCKKLENHEIQSLYLRSTSMESALLEVAQYGSIDEDLIEERAIASGSSARDVEKEKLIWEAPSRSVLRRLDETYMLVDPPMREEDVKEMIAQEVIEMKAKNIKKRQRPLQMPPPHYTSSEPSETVLLPINQGDRPLKSNLFEGPTLPTFVKGPASKFDVSWSMVAANS